MSEKKLIVVTLLVSTATLVIVGVGAFKAITAKTKVDEVLNNPVNAFLSMVGIKK